MNKMKFLGYVVQAGVTLSPIVGLPLFFNKVGKLPHYTAEVRTQAAEELPLWEQTLFKIDEGLSGIVREPNCGIVALRNERNYIKRKVDELQATSRGELSQKERDPLIPMGFFFGMLFTGPVLGLGCRLRSCIDSSYTYVPDCEGMDD